MLLCIVKYRALLCCVAQFGVWGCVVRCCDSCEYLVWYCAVMYTLLTGSVLRCVVMCVGMYS